jgi:predicted MFS family arabinose efflux permease
MPMNASMGDPQAPPSSGAYRRYVILLLFLAYMFNYVDRTLLGIIQEPIKKEFGLTDFQVGLLGGPAFALFYTLAALPIARYVERASRRNVIGAALIIFSAMTALCGATVTHVQLFLTRMGVSVGEAGLAPASQSLISDYFPGPGRTRAIAFFSLGVPVGSLLATFVGGSIAQALGWRAAFFALGLPGVVLAILFVFTVREPARAGAESEVPGMFTALKILAAKPSFRHLLAGATVTAVVSYSVGQYLTSFLVRAHGLPIASAARYTGLALGLFGAIGTFSGGYVTDRFVSKDRSMLGIVPALGLLVAVPLYLLAFLSPALMPAVIALMLGAMCHYITVAPMYAISQAVASPRMRATSVALLLFSLNLAGYGLGPPVVGAISDHLAAWFAGPAQACPIGSLAPACAAASAKGLRLALAGVTCLQIWGAVHYWRAGANLKSDWFE